MPGCICEELRKFAGEHEGIKAIYSEKASVKGGVIYHFFVEDSKKDIEDLFRLQEDFIQKGMFFSISILRKPADYRKAGKYNFLEECVYVR